MQVLEFVSFKIRVGMPLCIYKKGVWDPMLLLITWEFPKIRGTLFGGPHNKDYSILGSILGSPNFGKLPHVFEPLLI